MTTVYKNEKLIFSIKNTCKIFYCLLAFIVICDFNVNAQNINNAKSEFVDSPIVEDNIRIVPEILFQGIEIENKSEKKIINAKLQRIDQSKTDSNQILSDPLQEKLRQQQLDLLKTQLIGFKKNKNN